jgi:dTDP-4-amino-4,6-dideoxygalactose transaminase
MAYRSRMMKVKLLDLQAQYLPIRGEIRRAIDEVCDSQTLTLGPAVERFEKNLAEYCQVKYAIGVSSGTDALLCALMALGVGPGDEVIVPTFTFFATAGCVARLGAKIVFADIEYGSFNINPDDVARRITPKTRAIIPVHLFGQMAKIEQLTALAEKHGIAIVEDAAQAIGAKRNGRRACSVGTMGCLSFYPTKNLGAFGDAGAICTNDEKLAEKCRKLRVHGSGHTYYHEMVGGMFRMAGIQGAVLDVKLKHLESWHQGRRRNASIYDQALAGSSVVTPAIDEGNWSIYNQFCVRVEHRDHVKKRLEERGISTAIYYPLPLHLQPCFANLGYKKGDYPESERACDEVLALPVYPELSKEQVMYAAENLRTVTE